MKRFWEYIDGVTSGEIVTNRYIKLAVNRFIKQYEQWQNDTDYPYEWKEEKAQLFIDFAETCKQYKDRFAGKPLKLMPWQCFLFGNIYGWRKKKDGTRQYRKAVVFVGRKNGKSSMMVPVILWDAMTVPGSECYCLATKRDQAKIVFEAVTQTVKQDEWLSSAFKNYRSANRLVFQSNASIITPLASDSSKLDGLNPSCAVCDEIAVYKDFSLINVIESGMGSRPDPFIFEITSGSDNMNSAGALEFEQGKKTLEGIIDDTGIFYLLYTIDAEDDWRDPNCFIKANPSIGVSISMERLMVDMKEAKDNFSKEAEFRCKRLCSFISPQSVFIPYQTWRKCIDNGDEWEVPPMSECVSVAGIDLSQRVDFTAYSVYSYHQKSGRFFTRHRYYLPEDQIESKCKNESHLIRKWVNDGYIKTNPGKVCAYEQLFQDLEDDINNGVKEVLYDPWNAGELISRMYDKCDLIEVKQSMREISPYMKDWEAQIVAGKVADNNPVTAWMVGNLDVLQDMNGNIRPVKHGNPKDPTIHIDGCVTSLMACGRLCQLLAAGELDTRSAEEIEADAEAFFANFDY